jgi:hypothetical protein
MSILKSLSFLGSHARGVVRDAAKKSDVLGMTENSFLLPIWVRYGVGCEREFAEFWIFRLVSCMGTRAGKSSTTRCGRWQAMRAADP